jgi:hypothetical protein
MEHNMVCVTTTHLREHDRRTIDLPRLLHETQVKDNRRRVKLAFKQETEFCMRIRVERGARLGRPVVRVALRDSHDVSARLIWN